MSKTAKPVETGMFSKARVPYLSGLRYFYCVAKFGSFSAAAEALAIAPSAVNRQVASLEERLGERLFDRARGRGGLQLTDVGAVLYVHMTAVMNELSVADEEINLLRGLQRGHIRIGVNEIVATQMLPDILKTIHSGYPQLTFEIIVQNSPIIVEKLQAGTRDRVARSFSRTRRSAAGRRRPTSFAATR